MIWHKIRYGSFCLNTTVTVAGKHNMKSYFLKSAIITILLVFTMALNAKVVTFTLAATGNKTIEFVFNVYDDKQTQLNTALL